MNIPPLNIYEARFTDPEYRYGQRYKNIAASTEIAAKAIIESEHPGSLQIYLQPVPPLSSVPLPLVLHCLRCDHQWIRRTFGSPCRCSKCKARNWDKPRTLAMTRGAICQRKRRAKLLEIFKCRVDTAPT